MTCPNGGATYKDTSISGITEMGAEKQPERGEGVGWSCIAPVYLSSLTSSECGGRGSKTQTAKEASKQAGRIDFVEWLALRKIALHLPPLPLLLHF
ncbi:hypothetical protein [Botryobacter ruber]|uniref:hypothetical protein n=1 Tax=Botryobacter ruber TaxID=2171629 RepID=UPI000FEC4DFC|nr:hypothetical protein [Botryobacter ruber]